MKKLQTGSIATNTSNTQRKLSEISLPNGTKLDAYPGGIEDQLIKFIQSDEYKNGTAESMKDKWFLFDDLNFKLGRLELTPESKRQFDNLVAILKCFPDVKIKIGGYTDKIGDDAANLKLSDGRAKAVKTALEKEGVATQVPQAEGYGEKFAVVPETATDEERKADRKIAVRLIKDEPKLQVKLNELLVGKIIEFENGTDKLTPKGQAILDEIVPIIKGSTDNLEVSGHTDNAGRPELNKLLSERRAKAVLNYLVGKGIEADRLTSKGYGQDKPIADNNTPEGKQRNRRIEFEVIKP
jgi:outer membrane protein OmpA-like peptidoglycan-associated protein